MLRRFAGTLADGFIVIESAAGLGNRMLSLEGAILLGRELGMRVYLGWLENAACGCRFEDLFELPNGEFEVLGHPARDFNGVYRPVPRMVAGLREGWGRWLSKKWQAGLLRYRYRFDTMLKPHRDYEKGRLTGMAEMSELKKRRRIYMNTYFNVHRDLNPGGPERRYDYLRPTAELRERVEAIASRFGGNTVGVHIRWGDEGWKRRRRHPLSEFVRLMREEVRRDSGVRFYVSTESAAVVSRLRVLFGERIVVQGDAVLERNSAAGMKSAVVDMWALGRTRKVIGSVKSSFPEVAARLEGVELQMVDVLKPGKGGIAAC